MSHLTTAQLITLKAAILAETDVAFVALRTANNEAGMASWYNADAAPVFIAWRTAVTTRETGQAFNGGEWAGMTGANHTRLQTVAQYLESYSPALSDIRAMFNDIWSGAGGTLTRASLLALWKRSAKRVEKLFAAGVGTDAAPASLVFEGAITAQHISDALRT